MVKICVVCGKEFEAKRNYAKYCCDVCKNYSRYALRRAELKAKADKNRDEAISLYNSGVQAKEAAAILGVCTGVIYQYWREAGLARQLTPLQAEVKRLRELGKCSVEIADLIGRKSSNVIHIANSIGMPFSDEEKEKSISVGLERTRKNSHGGVDARLERSKKFVDENHPEWIYIDGFIGSDGFCTLRCKACGSIIKKSAIAVRRAGATLKCPECSRSFAEERNKNRVKQEEERKKEKEEKKKAKFWSQEFPQLSFIECAQCGGLFYGKGKYCSEECKRKAFNRAHDHRIERAGIIDKSITLEKLFFRDRGKCWICGGECDYKDHKVDESGSFIVGANYPTIDHVYPLSKGGNHTWENVKLAHHRCNTLKSDKVVS